MQENAFCLTDKRFDMKKSLPLFSLLLLLIGCNDAMVQKPEKRIDKEKMVNIIYDITILDAMRTRNASPAEHGITRDYIYKKYNIDSLQFAQNNEYYASDIQEYKKIYDKVNARVEKEKNAVDSVLKKVTPSNKTTPAAPKSDSPQVK